MPKYLPHFAMKCDSAVGSGFKRFDSASNQVVSNRFKCVSELIRCMQTETHSRSIKMNMSIWHCLDIMCRRIENDHSHTRSHSSEIWPLREFWRRTKRKNWNKTPGCWTNNSQAIKLRLFIWQATAARTNLTASSAYQWFTKPISMLIFTHSF